MTPGNEWEGDSAFIETVIGDSSWKNYSVSVNIRLNKNNHSYGSVMGRATEMHRSRQMPEGYSFKLFSDGKWQLLAADPIISKGFINMKNNEWNNLQLSMNNDLITAFINHAEVAAMIDKKYSHGVCGLGSSYDQN